MRSVELLKSLPLHLQEIVRPVIQRNAFWLHPEALLLAMAADDDSDIRAEAVTRIEGCRRVPRREGVLEFRIPRVEFSASRYTELINWEAEEITEPPLTAHLSDEDIHAILESPLQVQNYPVHTQDVERTWR